MLDAVAKGAVLGASGVLPFVHTNLGLQVLQNLSGAGTQAVAFVVAFSFSHLVFETVPALLLFCTSTEQGMAVLPHQSLVLEGRGAFALKKILAAILAATAVSVALSPLLFLVLPLVREFLGENIKYAFALLLAAYFLSDLHAGMLNGFLIFTLSGIFGLVVFSAPVAEPLFPLLTGLFGIPAMLSSERLLEKEQEEAELEMTRNEMLVVIGCCVAGAFSTLFPALTVAVLLGATALFFERSGGLLAAGPALAASKTFFDFVYALGSGKSRSMAAALVEKNALESMQAFFAVGASAVVSTCLAVAAVLLTYKWMVRFLSGLDFFKLRTILLAVFTFLIAYFNGVLGLVVAVGAAGIGLLPLLVKTRRGYLVGSLMLPALLHFFA